MTLAVDVRRLGERLVRTRPLRAADSLQLATALALAVQDAPPVSGDLKTR
jgi:hypothetical protein